MILTRCPGSQFPTENEGNCNIQGRVFVFHPMILFQDQSICLPLQEAFLLDLSSLNDYS